MNLAFNLIELLELVLSLLEFCDKLVEFGSSENRWRIGSGRRIGSGTDIYYTKIDF